MSRHRAPKPPRPPRFRWLFWPLTSAATILPVASLGIIWHGTWEQALTHAAALPTAIEKAQQPSGHGGPLSPPTIAADLPVWEPSDGPVIVDHRPLSQPAPITTASVAPSTPELVGTPPLPTSAATPAPTPPEAQPTPIVSLPIPTEEPEVIPPEITEPAPTSTEPEPTTPPTEEAP